MCGPVAGYWDRLARLRTRAVHFFITGAGGIVEVQGTAETVAFSQEQFDAMMALARKGIGELVSLQ